MNNFEVFTTTDKARRDQMFEDLRKSDDPLERQVVKFSSNEPVLDSHADVVAHRSTWSVAYPRT